MKTTNLSIITFGCVLFCFLTCPQTSWASYHGANPNVPPIDGKYVSPADWHANFAAGIVIKNVIHSGFTDSFPPPPPSQYDTHSFGSRIDGMVSMDNGQNYQPFWATGNVTVRIASGTDSGNTRNFDTEMLQLDISGGSLPPGVMIRESPTQTTPGQTSITSGDYYAIDSFFDVYIELSLDGGANWYPSQSPPAHMELAVNSDVPTVSQWGLIVMAGVLLTAGAIVIVQRRRVAA